MPGLIKVRDATSKDLPSILEIERTSFSHPWTLDSFKRELLLPFSRIVVATAEKDGRTRVAGYICRWIVADECHILNVAVHPDVRRLRIGEHLMRDTILEAKSKGADVITLEVRRSNLPARSLYRKLNFEERRL